MSRLLQLAVLAALALLSLADEGKEISVQLCNEDDCKASSCDEDSCSFCVDKVCCRADGCTPCIQRCKADCKFSKCAKNCFNYCYHMHAWRHEAAYGQTQHGYGGYLAPWTHGGYFNGLFGPGCLSGC